MQEALNEIFQNYYKDVYAYLYSISQLPATGGLRICAGKSIR